MSSVAFFIIHLYFWAQKHKAGMSFSSSILQSSSWMDRAISTLVYFGASFFLPKIRAIGISKLPLAFRTLFGRNTITRRKASSPEDVSVDSQLLLYRLWEYLQIACVPSGLFNIYSSIIVKATAMLNIILVVQESIHFRLKEKQLRSSEEADTSNTKEEGTQERPKGWLRWFRRGSIQEEAKLCERSVVASEAASSSSKSSTSENGGVDAGGSIDGNKKIPVDLKKHVRQAKQVVQGHRESVIDDVAWGSLQLAFIYKDMTQWQALYMAWMVVLLQILEEAILHPDLTRSQKVRKASWIVGVAWLSGKILFR